MIYTNQEELDAALVEWQKTLRLQDWDIKASIVREKNLMMNNVVAAVRWSFTEKSAIVELMDPIDYADNPDEELDHEISLVHEFLHLHYAGFDKTEKGSTEERLLEQSIEAISRSLVKLKRVKVVDPAEEKETVTLAHRVTHTTVTGQIIDHTPNATRLDVELTSNDWYLTNRMKGAAASEEQS